MNADLRLLVVGEGDHELKGALSNLVTRLVSVGVQIEVEKVSRRDIHAHHGKGGGLVKRAIRWMLEAYERGFDGIVLVVDEDGDGDRRKQLDIAQEWTPGLIPRAFGVAIRTFDAWILADEKALSEVLTLDVSTQPYPESITNPKQVCLGLLERAGAPFSQSEMYARVCQTADIRRLESRCRLGFAPFADRARALSAIS